MTSQVWYRDSLMDNPEEPHVTDPPHYLTLQELLEKTGVKVTKVPNCHDEAEQAKIRKEGGYNYFDWLNVSREVLGETFEERSVVGVSLSSTLQCSWIPFLKANVWMPSHPPTPEGQCLGQQTIPQTSLHEKREVRCFNDEHLHEDDEIRLITDGSAYFEMRDFQDKWIRLHVAKGDLMHLPAGLYHRLALDAGERVQMLRLFKDSPQWQALNRPEGDKSTARQHYLHTAAPSAEL